MCNIHVSYFFKSLFNHLLYKMILLVKAIKTIKFITIGTKNFLLSSQLHYLFLLIDVALFSSGSQRNVFEHHGQIHPLPRACNQQVCACFDLLTVVSHQASDSQMVYRAIKISQDFHETSGWSYCLLNSFPCKLL